MSAVSRCNKGPPSIWAIKREHNEMASPPASITTEIMDLNDDCLRYIFKEFGTHDLGGVVDVCRRFRTFAQERFSALDTKCFVFGNIFHKCKSTEKSLQTTAKFLRDFGAFFEQIYVSFEGEEQPNYATKYIELLKRHTSEELRLLEIWHLDMSDDIVEKLRAPLAHLHALNLKKCTLTDSFLRNLSLWGPQLGMVKLIDVSVPTPDCFIGLHHNHPMLERIVFGNIDVSGSDIESMITSNPQLKQVSFDMCPNLNDDIIPMVAKRLPKLELFLLHVVNSTDRLTENMKHLNEMSCLSYLSLSINAPNAVMLNLREIGVAKMPLETLVLHKFTVGDGDAPSFVAEISKLKNLKKLMLVSVGGLYPANILDICKSLEELTMLTLKDSGFVLTADHLTKIICSAGKLEDMTLIEKHDEERMCECITPVEYTKLVRSIQEGRESQCLELRSNIYCFHSVPDEMMQAHQSCFKNVFMCGAHAETITLADDEGETDTEEEDSADEPAEESESAEPVASAETLLEAPVDDELM